MKQKLKNLSKNQIEELKKLGFNVKIKNVYWHECPFCGWRTERKTAKAALRSFNIHLSKCKFYEWVKIIDKILPEGCRMGDIAFLLTGKFPKDYKPKLKNILKLKEIRERIE